MPLSKFMSLYCNRTMREAVIRWFRTYDRIAMMDGILDLATHKPIDYREEERHLKTEVTKIIDLELGGL
jgi:hypothetical protein